LLALSLVWFGSLGSSAAYLSASVPANAGVNTGVTAPGLDDQDLVKMREAGIRYTRFDLLWHEVEKAKGRYDWARFDRLIARLKRYGIAPILILDYNNKLYDPDSGGIRSDEARDGYANFAGDWTPHKARCRRWDELAEPGF
jgi:hypothetical protein